MACGESRYLQMIPEGLAERVDNAPVVPKADFSETASCGKSGQTESQGACGAQALPRRVRHGKYGVGTVTEEDEEKLTVDFGELGVKTFFKDFVVLEFER